ncbi:hypothetical protein [Nostoc sp. CALU 1950]|uniref:hypothetical protein n=1 Tax=Nostoc sp. CALU 1950 TaxID=3104321 RepID=UPI003EB80FBB
MPLLIEITVVMAIAYFYFNAELNHFLPKHSHFVEDKASIDFLELGFYQISDRKMVNHLDIGIRFDY